MARTPLFYFGTLIFFVGLLLFAAGISGIMRGVSNIITVAELIGGFILLAVGYRATTRSTQREPW
jgi:hypothetical protein